MSQALERLRVLLGEIYDLERVGFLLAWDQETAMPPGGAEGRAEQRSTIGRAAHERLASGELGPFVEAARDADGEVLEGPFPVEAQRAFSVDLLERLGSDDLSWRLDHSEHPFTASIGIEDIRLTSHFRETHLGGIFAAIHEF